MSALTRKHHTSNQTIDCFSKQGYVYRIPLEIANKYRIIGHKLSKAKNTQSKHSIDNEVIDADLFFKEMDEKYTEAGALLRGTRHRENLSQKAFAERIEVEQSDLSKMENGKRPIGKTVAKRIEKEFGVDYRYFLG